MYLHIIIAISCWLAGILIPNLPEKYMVTFLLMGFVALLLFFKDAIGYVNKQFLSQVEEAENESAATLHSFQGKFLMIRDEDSPFSDEFTYIIFQHGQMEVPLFCRNLRIIQKAAMANNELMIYYKNNILVNVEEIE